MVTDFWSPPNSISRQLPGRIGELMKSRFHRELQTEDITGFNQSGFARELIARFCKNTGWTQIIKRNDWFQNKAVEVLRNISSNKPTAAFSYSYAAKTIFEEAQTQGIATVLGQIDPGPQEMQRVHEIERAHGAPLTPAPPQEYWEAWRTEIDLADTIVVNSKWSKELLLESSVDEKKIKIIPLVYELDDLNEYGAKIEDSLPKQLKVLYLGQVIARKGIIELIDAIKTCGTKLAHWTVVGGGDTNLLKQLNQHPNVQVTGQVSRDQAKNYYRSHDVFILPTHSDGFAITQLEAMAYGMPVIASKQCGDVVEHMKTGLLLDDVSPTSIVNAITRLLDQPELLRLFRENIANQKFRTIDDLGNDLISIFDD